MNLSISLVPDFFWLFAAGCFGAIVGSYVNMAAYRLPRGISTVTRTRSFCPSCSAQLAWFENIPILSYLALLGRCRHCGKSIGVRYLIVELLVTGLFILSAYQFFTLNRALTLPYGYAWWRLFAVLGVQCFLIADLVLLSVVDLEMWLIPEQTTLPWVALGFILAALFPELHAAATNWTGSHRGNALIDSFTGLVLGAAKPIPLWNTLWLPALFTASALSTSAMATAFSVAILDFQKSPVLEKSLGLLAAWAIDRLARSSADQRAALGRLRWVAAAVVVAVSAALILLPTVFLFQSRLPTKLVHIVRLPTEVPSVTRWILFALPAIGAMVIVAAIATARTWRVDRRHAWRPVRRPQSGQPARNHRRRRYSETVRAPDEIHHHRRPLRPVHPPTNQGRDARRDFGSALSRPMGRPTQRVRPDSRLRQWLRGSLADHFRERFS